MPRNVIDILNDCPLFAKVPPRCFARLVSMARLKSFQTGEVIFRDGQACPGVYVVSTGSVRVFKTSPGGKEHILHMVGPGQTFAEVAAIGDFPVPASAAAIEPTTCVLLPRDRFRQGLEEDHALCLGLMAGMTQWVRHLVGLIEDIVLRDAAGRVAGYLLRADKSGGGESFTLPILKKNLASHLNLTSETLSRTLRRMTDAGLIAEADGGRLRLIDRQALRLMAEGQFPRM